MRENELIPDETSKNEIAKIPKSDSKPRKYSKESLSAIYRLSPRHRSFVLNLRKLNFVQKQAYLATYPNVKPESAEALSSQLMKRRDIQDALEEMYDQLNVKEAESFEAVLLRFVRKAENAKRDADKLRANENIAKMLGHLPDESSKTAVFISSDDAITKIRESLERRGKTIHEITAVNRPEESSIVSDTTNKIMNEELDKSSQPIDTITNTDNHVS